MEDLEPFAYEPLDLTQDSIRLLQFTEIDELGRLHCTLRHARRKESEYFALSYTWGATGHESTIVVDGKAMKIRRNLSAFLREYICDLTVIEGDAYENTKASSLPDALDKLPRRIRSQSGSRRCLEQQDYDLWVDAICLNQADVKERNHQVRQMYQIYHDANTVLAWVSEYGQVRDHPLCLSRTFTTRDYKTIGLDWPECSTIDENRHNAHRTMGEKRLNHSKVLETAGYCDTFGRSTFAISSSFLNSSYWTRVWVAQELAAAQNVVLMTHGKRCSWYQLWSKLESEIANKDGNHRHLVKTPAYKHHELRAYTHEPLSLWDLLERFANLNCSEIRDRVFGLFSLAAERDVIRVNYEISTTDLAIEIASVCIPRKSKLVNLAGFEILTAALDVDAQELIAYLSANPKDNFQYFTVPTDDPIAGGMCEGQSLFSCPACCTDIARLGTDSACIQGVICIQDDTARTHILRVRMYNRTGLRGRESSLWIGPIRSPYDNRRVSWFIQTQQLQSRTTMWKPPPMLAAYPPVSESKKGYEVENR